MTESYDAVVVGAGWFGLAAAKAYTQLHPTANLAVLETAESCGGTWSQNRLYPGLKSNNMVGTYEYPDFPMAEAVYGVKPDNHIPGAVLHRYLTDFAKHFAFFDRIQFNTSVDLVERLGEKGWRLSVTSPAGTRTVDTEKLILATGLTSTPNLPTYENEENFGGPLFHAKDFCREASTLKGVKNAVVVGGAKSAFDVAYALVQDGAEVDLIVRPNGHGPVWIAPPFVTPFKKRMDQLLNIRWMSWFSPCPWGEEDGYPGIRNFLHGTAVGRFIVDSFWKVLSGDVLSANAYDSHPELQKLKPWHSAFWIGSGLSILNYDSSLFDLVKEGKIRVHIDNISRLEPHRVILASGVEIDAEAIVCSTGWKKESTIKFAGLGEEKLGLPITATEKRSLDQSADAKVLSLYPRLAEQPKLRFQPKEANPLRYYRFMVPSTMVSCRNLAFAGMISTVSTATCATIQGHWIAAFLGGKLDRTPASEQEIEDEIMLHTQWGKWRYPCGYGADLPDFVFEGLPYCNMLMKDLGLDTHRKSSYFQELTSPYLPADFRGLVDEWKSGHDVDESDVELGPQKPAICRFSEPIAFNSILAYTYAMVKDFGVEEKDRGFYAGLLVSAYAVAEAITSMGWGALSDRVGRKPVVLFGLVGVAISTKAYAVQPFVWTLGGIIGSAMGGFLAQPAKFYPSIFPEDGVFGRYPYLLPNVVSVVAIIFAVIQGIIFLEETNEYLYTDDNNTEAVEEDDFADETTPLRRGARGSVDRGRGRGRSISTSHSRPRFAESSLPLPIEHDFDLRRSSFGTVHSIKVVPDELRTELLRQNGHNGHNGRQNGRAQQNKKPKVKTFNFTVVMLITTLIIFSYHQMAAGSLLPTHLLDDPAAPRGHLDLRGGLGYDVHDVGKFLAVNGVLGLLIQGLIFPIFVERVGVWGSFIWMIVLYPTAYLLLPFLSALPEPLTQAGIYFSLIMQSFYGIIVGPVTLILLKDATPTPQALGKVNGLAMSGACLARTVSPPLVGIIYGFAGSAAAWWSCSGFALLGVLQVIWVPRKHIHVDHVEVDNALTKQITNSSQRGDDDRGRA
ncbi:flavin-binding monooxygenase-like protein [Colletotrichum karsti]|uniref:Flavin-binding monooxygenase-like protein n=1 Tax=Colletotrichum karsti TaxID=1095194 RepID=A0A9P6LPI3_9PEZI|nr:flavin-binding monooxygenase-like protein [Colletotrichum karsti]KAF9879662.1 flavin-binding monooxygenase-like protein [Colletotrichum karsti]